MFYRYLVSWTAYPNPDPNEPTAASAGVPAREHVNEQYQKFTHAFYDVHAIWLDKDTYDLIQGFSEASRDLLNDLTDMEKPTDGIWRLPDGTAPDERRKDKIKPQYNKVRNVLRSEVEISRSLIPYRIVIRKNRE
jgi:hypothetical protein